MNRAEYNELLAQRIAVQGIIENIPDEDIIDRNSFAGRLSQIDKWIATAEVDVRPPAKTRLTFNGGPVLDSYGIAADFGLVATRLYIKAVTQVAGALDRYSPLANRGPIPNQGQNQLLITGTALGSFGFEIEERSDVQLSMQEESPVSIALKQTQAFLQGTTGSDDELTESVTGTDPRVTSSIRLFLDLLARRDATCTVETNERIFRFEDTNQVRRSLSRLAQTNLHQETLTFSGAFEGALPTLRTFEFRQSGSNELVTGKLGPSITEPNLINLNLQKLTQIRVTATRVGNGRPHYVLNNMPDGWGGSPPALGSVSPGTMPAKSNSEQDLSPR